MVTRRKHKPFLKGAARNVAHSTPMHIFWWNAICRRIPFVRHLNEEFCVIALFNCFSSVPLWNSFNSAALNCEFCPEYMIWRWILPKTYALYCIALKFTWKNPYYNVFYYLLDKNDSTEKTDSIKSLCFPLYKALRSIPSKCELPPPLDFTQFLSFQLTKMVVGFFKMQFPQLTSRSLQFRLTSITCSLQFLATSLSVSIESENVLAQFWVKSYQF